MKERVSILVDYIPRYGEILLGVGSIALSHHQDILDNSLARKKLKDYLLTKAVKRINLSGISRCEEFQKIVYEYTGKFVSMVALTNSNNEDKTVNILLADFFLRSIWPILVNKYMDKIYPGVNSVVIGINVKKNVYLKIYDEDNPQVFFKEFKEFLLCNHIVICEAQTKEDGDMLLKLMIPIPPHQNIDY